MSKFNGHRNWNHWNVSLWINNDEGLYRLALDCIKAMRYRTSFSRNGFSPRDLAAQMMLDRLEIQSDSEPKTLDGAPYSVTTIRAAMRGM
jgi:hypothetical protein